MTNKSFTVSDIRVGGMPIVVNPMLDEIPKMQLSKEVCEHLAPEFVIEINNWMREFFGTHSQVMIINDEIAVMGQQQFDKLKLLNKPGIEHLDFASIKRIIIHRPKDGY